MCGVETRGVMRVREEEFSGAPSVVGVVVDVIQAHNHKFGFSIFFFLWYFHSLDIYYPHNICSMVPKLICLISEQEKVPPKIVEVILHQEFMVPNLSNLESNSQFDTSEVKNGNKKKRDVSE